MIITRRMHLSDNMDSLNPNLVITRYDTLSTSDKNSILVIGFSTFREFNF
jgi:hypothetical protein